MRKKIIMYIGIVLSIFFILCQTVNANQIISQEIIKKESDIIKNKINVATEYSNKIEKLLLSIPNDTIKSLHDIVMLVWEMISVFIGHNMVSMTLTRLLCCWFVFPIVVLNNIGDINITGGGLFGYMKEYLDSINIEDLTYRLGLLAIFILPFVYIFAFIISLAYVIKEGFHIEGGILEGIQNDLSYIYGLSYNVGNFKPNNNNTSNYSFLEYMNTLDIKGYYYHIGIFGLCFMPSIFLSMYKTRNNKLDGIPDRPFLNFILKLIKMVLDFILRILNKQPII